MSLLRQYAQIGGGSTLESITGEFGDSIKFTRPEG